MARLDSFDVTAGPNTWFDVDNDQNGWFDVDLVDCRITPPPPPPPPAPPRPSRRTLTRRGGVGGGGGSSGYVRRRRPVECLTELQKAYVRFPDPEPDADYALLNITEGATVRALASGRLTHIEDARGHLALKLEADDGTNYYYADLSCYVGAADRRVEAGEAIAKSAREAVPEITQGDARALPEKAGDGPPLRVVAPVFIETPLPPAPKKRWVKLVPIAPLPAPPDEWAVRAPERQRVPVIAYVAGIGALAALLYALSRIPRRPKRPKRQPKRRPRRRKR